MNETLNKLVCGTEIVKWLLIKRVNEMSSRMTLMRLKPGQHLNLQEPMLYIVLDGKVKIATHESFELERAQIAQKIKDILIQRGSDNSTDHIAPSALNKLKIAANTFIAIRKFGTAQTLGQDISKTNGDSTPDIVERHLTAAE